MLSEWATYNELMPQMLEVRSYAPDTLNNGELKRQLKKQYTLLLKRVNTAKNKVPAAYIYIKAKKHFEFFGFVVLEGSEGESYATIYNHETCHAIVIHSHAINRYIERTNYQGTLEQATGKLMLAMGTSKATHDSDTTYLYFDDGIFICNTKDQVLHVRTFITNEQCHRNQRLWSRRSEMQSEQIIKIIEKLL